MKKIISLLLVAILSISIVGCSTTKLEVKAEDTVKSFFDAYKKGEFEEAMEYVSKDFDSKVEDIEMGDFEENFENFESEAQKQAVIKVFGKLNYEIIKTEESEDTAIVTTKMDVPDLSQIIGEYLEEALAVAFETAFDENANEEEIEAKMEEMFLDKLNSEEITMVQMDVDINLVMEEDQWKIKANEDFANAITGNLLELAEEFEEGFSN